MAVSPAMLLAAFPGEQRGRALGLNAVVVGLGISIGPTLGGVITQHFGWRWIFYVNVPLGVAGVIGVDARPSARARRRARAHRLAGRVLARGRASGRSPARSRSPRSSAGPRRRSCAGLAIAVSFARGARRPRCARVRDPLIDPTLFANRVFASASVSLLLAFMATFAVAFLMPFYLEQLRGWPAQRAGLFAHAPAPDHRAGVARDGRARRSHRHAQARGRRGCSSRRRDSRCLGGDRRVDARRVVLLLALAHRRRTGDVPAAEQQRAHGRRAPRSTGRRGRRARHGRVVGQSLSIAMAGALFAAFRGMRTGGRAAWRARPSPPRTSPRSSAGCTRRSSAAR